MTGESEINVGSHVHELHVLWACNHDYLIIGVISINAVD